MHALFWLAVASPLLALWPSSQDPAETDWAKEVERACTASRYGLRLAAARKVASGGAAAVPAILAYEAKVGRPQLPANLVEAIADGVSVEPAVMQLLTGWATDGDFYWRGQAMRGLATRAALAGVDRDALATLFARYVDDPAWLTRTHARLGEALLGGEAGTAAALARPEDDPRARVRLVALLLGKSQPGNQLPPLQPLLDALGEERAFLGDPWGKRLAQEAYKALRSWLGDDLPAAMADGMEDKQKAIELVTGAAKQKSGQELRVPELRPEETTAFVGGFEILSCKNGDRFVRWTADGQIYYGLTVESGKQLRIATDSWKAWWQERGQLPIQELHGVVVCDSLQLVWQEPSLRSKIAPEALPAPVAEWLKRLPAMLEESDAATAKTLGVGFGQFAPR